VMNYCQATDSSENASSQLARSMKSRSQSWWWMIMALGGFRLGPFQFQATPKKIQTIHDLTPCNILPGISQKCVGFVFDLECWLAIVVRCVGLLWIMI
jgi:hypothetical protein